MALFTNKVAIVTGGASGIGAACARLLSSQGALVWVADLDPRQAADAATVVGGRGVALDVRQGTQWADAIRTVLAESGSLDVLVNAAGVSRTPGTADVLEVEIGAWREVFAVNVEGTLLGCQHAIRAMGVRGGAIVNVSSTTALAPTATLGAYGASKAAVYQLTKSVAAACALRGLPIRCNAVLPGMTETPMTAGMPAAYREAWIGQIPAARFAAAGEVAEAIVFLAGDGASYVNGTGLLVDGGLTSRQIVK